MDSCEVFKRLECMCDKSIRPEWYSTIWILINTWAGGQDVKRSGGSCAFRVERLMDGLGNPANSKSGQSLTTIRHYDKFVAIESNVDIYNLTVPLHFSAYT